MGEQGLVKDISGENVIVLMTRLEACAKCGACSNGFLKDELLIEAVNLCDARKGDLVSLELSECYFLKSVLIMYGIPLISLLSGFILGFFLSPAFGLGDFKELISFIIGIVFVFSAFWGIKLGEKKRRSKRKFTLPKAIEKK